MFKLVRSIFANQVTTLLYVYPVSQQLKITYCKYRRAYWETLNADVFGDIICNILNSILILNFVSILLYPKSITKIFRTLYKNSIFNFKILHFTIFPKKICKDTSFINSLEFCFTVETWNAKFLALVSHIGIGTDAISEEKTVALTGLLAVSKYLDNCYVSTFCTVELQNDLLRHSPFLQAFVSWKSIHSTEVFPLQVDKIV